MADTPPVGVLSQSLGPVRPVLVPLLVAPDRYTHAPLMPLSGSFTSALTNTFTVYSWLTFMVAGGAWANDSELSPPHPS